MAENAKIENNPHSNTSFKFNPPLSQQRYSKVINIIKHHLKVSKVSMPKILDLGCSDCSFFMYLKNFFDCPLHLTFMDIDGMLLKNSQYKTRPLPYDCLKKRECPLTIKLVKGNAKVPHQCSWGTDIVTMIEFIEHLHEPELPDVINHVFKFARPNLVIVTTPNKEFNRNFPNFSPNKFRHYDHKFEWTSREFESWSQKIVEEFSQYRVYFSGCGEDESGVYASQIAVFVLKRIDFPINSTKLLNKNIVCMNDDVCSGNCLDNDKGSEYNYNSPDCQVVFYAEYPWEKNIENEKDKLMIGSHFNHMVKTLKEIIYEIDSQNIDVPHHFIHPSFPIEWGGSCESENLNPVEVIGLIEYELQLEFQDIKISLNLEDTFLNPDKKSSPISHNDVSKFPEELRKALYIVCNDIIFELNNLCKKKSNSDYCKEPVQLMNKVDALQNFECLPVRNILKTIENISNLIIGSHNTKSNFLDNIFMSIKTKDPNWLNRDVHFDFTKIDFWNQRLFKSCHELRKLKEDFSGISKFGFIKNPESTEFNVEMVIESFHKLIVALIITCKEIKYFYFICHLVKQNSNVFEQKKIQILQLTQDIISKLKQLLIIVSNLNPNNLSQLFDNERHFELAKIDKIKVDPEKYVVWHCKQYISSKSQDNFFSDGVYLYDRETENIFFSASTFIKFAKINMKQENVVEYLSLLDGVGKKKCRKGDVFFTSLSADYDDSSSASE